MSLAVRNIKFPIQLLRRSFAYQNSLIDVHPTVQNALVNKKPIVALESTIITHGMPYPQNLETALEVEEIVRVQGATPATIAIINGRIKVGMSSEDLKNLASIDSQNIIKCSRRDLPFVVGNNLSGGTTVAGTMILADMVGIRIFATGGIGGVHREGENTLDVSADLVELGRTPVCVVSSGVKSILDIPRTLEFLETQGVCVSTYGSPGGYFPDFYTTNSGCRVPYNVQTPEEAAKLIRSLEDLKLKSGMLIAVPVPTEHAMDKKEIDEAIRTALTEAKEKQIEGKAVTPFLLTAISNLTKGRSLASNIALIKNNAKTAAQIAKAFYKTPVHRKTKPNGAPVIIGGSILDLSITLLDEFEFQMNGATYQVKVKQTAGGVGRNLAEGIYKLYGSANFISAIGSDELGKSLLSLIPEPLTAGIYKDPQRSTSLCSVIFDKLGDCKLVLGNMEIHKSISPDLIEKNEDALSSAPLIVMDGNVQPDTMKTILKIARKHKTPVFFETTDMRIAAKPFGLPTELWQQIKFISPNIHELVEISNALTGQEQRVPDEKELLPFAKKVLESVHEHFHCILLTLGGEGVIVDRRETSSLLENIDDPISKRSIRFYPTVKITNLVNVSGAGDSFASGFIANMLRGKSEEDCVALGFYSAKKALQSVGAVPPKYFDSEPVLEPLKWKQL